MLVLTRKTSERIMIGDNVVVTVSKIQGNRVWIGLDAPDWVTVRREEVPAESSMQAKQEAK